MQQQSLCYVLCCCQYQCQCLFHRQMSLLQLSQFPKVVPVKYLCHASKCCHCCKERSAMSQEKTFLPQISITCASLPPNFSSHFYLNIFYRLPSDLFTSKFAPSLYGKFITQPEELKACDKPNLLPRLHVKLAMFHFVAVKMVYRTVLKFISIFQCPVYIYVYHCCTHKLQPLIHTSD